MNTETIKVETVTPEVETKLVKYANQTGLEKQSTETLVEAFRPIFAKARSAIADAAGVAESVKDATCIREIMRSRACRLALRKIRLESDETREKHKKHALLYGRAVDGFHNILLADLSPVETALKEAEDIAERVEAKRLAELKAAREAELVPLLDEPLLGNLADLSEADYMKKLSNAKLLRQAKLDADAKIEAERKAKEEAASIENAKLKAEAIAREAAAKAEREAAEKKLADERAEAARVAAEIKAKADADAKAAAEKAAQERAEIEAKAKAEAARLAEIAAKEKAAAEVIAQRAADEVAKARAELAAKAKAEADAIARVESERKTAAAAAKKAAAAPDKAKLKAFADSVRQLPQPTLGNLQVQSVLSDRVEQLAKWIETTATEELL